MIEFIEGFATESGEILVYLFDLGSGEQLGKTLVHVSEGCGLSPGQTLDAPPRAKQGYVMVRESDTWVELEDHRGTVYRTADGEPVEHAQVGALPDMLTKQPRPSMHHRWKGSSWVLDRAAKAKHELEVTSNTARTYLASTDWYVIRCQETGKAVPDDILAARRAAREAVAVQESHNV
ncbi:hypothetical protein D3C85_1258610 [compost metagenome]